MSMSRTKAFLFDFDGVIADTEFYYTDFWAEQGRKYFPEVEGFEIKIKGRSLKTIFTECFSDMPEAQEEIKQALIEQEKQMVYRYVEGAQEFLRACKGKVLTALVTSSSESKMRNVYQAMPLMRTAFDEIVTAADVQKSKPSPECYLLAAERLGVEPKECVVFEDSMAGVEAAKAAGMQLVALSTTLPREELLPLADRVIDNFLSVCPTDFLK